MMDWIRQECRHHSPDAGLSGIGNSDARSKGSVQLSAHVTYYVWVTNFGTFVK